MNLMEDLKAYVDGELSPERKAMVETEMDRDERLRQEMDEIRVLSRLIGDCVVQPEPVGLSALLVTLEKTKPQPLFAKLRKNPMQFGWAFALASFILLAILFPSFKRATDSAEMVTMDAKNADRSASSGAAASTPATEMERKTEISATGKANSSGGISTFGGRSEAPGSAVRGSNGVSADREALDFDTTKGATRNQNGSRLRQEQYGLSMPEEFRDDARDTGAGTTTGNVKQERRLAPSPHAGGGGAFQAGEGMAWAKPIQPLLIKTGNFHMQVTDVRASQAKVETLARSLHGYLQDSSRSEAKPGAPEFSFGLRVPVQWFDKATVEVRKLGKVLAESTNSQDVTADVVDTQARLKAKRIEAQGYEQMLRGAKKVPDMLEIRDRLGSVREEIESLEASDKNLRNQAIYSTLSVVLSQPEPAKPVVQPPAKPGWFDSAWNGASERAGGLGRWLAEVGMNLLVLAPVWVPVVIGLWWLGRRPRRR